MIEHELYVVIMHTFADTTPFWCLISSARLTLQHKKTVQALCAFSAASISEIMTRSWPIFAGVWQYLVHFRSLQKYSQHDFVYYVQLMIIHMYMFATAFGTCASIGYFTSCCPPGMTPRLLMEVVSVVQTAISMPWWLLWRCPLPNT